jgi:cell division protein FtsX
VSIVDDHLPIGQLPNVFVTPGRARALGLTPQPLLTVVRSPRNLTAEQRAAIRDAQDEERDAAFDTQGDGLYLASSVSMFAPTAGLDPRTLEALLTAAAFLLSLFVVAVNLALAAAETRDERDVLVVVGAPPSAMRRASGYKALLLTLLGATLAIPVGFLPVTVFTAASSDDLPLVFPWRVVLLLLLAVPLLAGSVTTACSRLALRLRPVRVSTMSFD